MLRKLRKRKKLGVCLLLICVLYLTMLPVTASVIEMTDVIVQGEMNIDSTTENSEYRALAKSGILTHQPKIYSYGGVPVYSYSPNISTDLSKGIKGSRNDQSVAVVSERFAWSDKEKVHEVERYANNYGHNLDSQLQTKLEMIAYYGYGYQNDQSPQRAQAAQELIWESMDRYVYNHAFVAFKDEFIQVSWVNETDKNQKLIDNYKAEISDLLAKKDTLPSFVGTVIPVVTGQSVKVVDSNGVLNQFEVLAPDGMAISYPDPNTLELTVTDNDVWQHPLKLKRKTHYKGKPQNYVSENSGMTWLKAGDPFEAAEILVNFTQETGDFELTKIDSTGQVVPNVRFRIGNDEYTTDKQGKIEVKNLSLGLLEYNEVDAPQEYIVNGVIRTAVIESKKTKRVVVSNDFVEDVIQLQVKNDFGQPIENAEYIVLDIDNQRVDRITTNKQGKAESKLLTGGSYTLKLVKVPDEYQMTADDETIVIARGADGVVLERPVIEKTIESINKSSIGLERVSYALKSKTEPATIHYKLDTSNLNRSKFADSEITLELLDEKNQKILSTQRYTISNVPESGTITIPHKYFKILGDPFDFQVRLSVLHTPAVKVLTNQLTITAWLPDEEVINPDPIHDGTLRGVGSFTEEVIEYDLRDNRVKSRGKEETYLLRLSKLEQIHQGEGFSYDVFFETNNQVSSDKPTELWMYIEADKIKATAAYEKSGDRYKIPLIVEGNVYKLPPVFIKKGVVNDVIAQSTYEALSPQERTQYRPGGNRVVTSDDVSSGNHDITFILESSLFGKHEKRLGVKRTLSITAGNDQNVVSPMLNTDEDKDEIPDIWNHHPIPDNWGVRTDNGSKALTTLEKKFLGYETQNKALLMYDFSESGLHNRVIEVEKGAQIPIIADSPHKKGHEFSGWMLKDTLYDTSSKHISIQEDVLLKPSYKPIDYTLTWDLDGGTRTSTSCPNTMQIGVLEISPTCEPEKQGFTFREWEVSAEGKKEVYYTGQDIPIESNTELKATWDPMPIEYSFDLNGGKHSARIFDGKTRYLNNSSLRIPKMVPERKGYIFDGWKAEGLAEKVQAGDIVQLEKATSFSAIWKPIKHTIKFELNRLQPEHQNQAGVMREKPIEEQEHVAIDVSSEINWAKTHALPGYTFIGFLSSLDGQIYKDNIINIEHVNQSITFHAQWVGQPIAVTWDLNGGITTQSDLMFKTAPHDRYTEIPELDIQQAGKRFTGWLNSDTQTIKQARDYIRFTKDTVLTAQWETLTPPAPAAITVPAKAQDSRFKLCYDLSEMPEFRDKEKLCTAGVENEQVPVIDFLDAKGQHKYILEKNGKKFKVIGWRSQNGVDLYDQGDLYTLKGIDTLKPTWTVMY